MSANSTAAGRQNLINYNKSQQAKTQDGLNLLTWLQSDMAKVVDRHNISAFHHTARARSIDKKNLRGYQSSSKARVLDHTIMVSYLKSPKAASKDSVNAKNYWASRKIEEKTLYAQWKSGSTSLGWYAYRRIGLAAWKASRPAKKPWVPYGTTSTKAAGSWKSTYTPTGGKKSAWKKGSTWKSTHKTKWQLGTAKHWGMHWYHHTGVGLGQNPTFHHLIGTGMKINGKAIKFTKTRNYGGRASAGINMQMTTPKVWTSTLTL